MRQLSGKTICKWTEKCTLVIELKSIYIIFDFWTTNINLQNIGYYKLYKIWLYIRTPWVVIWYFDQFLLPFYIKNIISTDPASPEPDPYIEPIYCWPNTIRTGGLNRLIQYSWIFAKILSFARTDTVRWPTVHFWPNISQTNFKDHGQIAKNKRKLWQF